MTSVLLSFLIALGSLRLQKLTVAPHYYWLERSIPITHFFRQLQLHEPSHLDECCPFLLCWLFVLETRLPIPSFSEERMEWGSSSSGGWALGRVAYRLGGPIPIVVLLAAERTSGTGGLFLQFPIELLFRYAFRLIPPPPLPPIIESGTFQKCLQTYGGRSRVRHFSPVLNWFIDYLDLILRRLPRFTSKPGKSPSSIRHDKKEKTGPAKARAKSQAHNLYIHAFTLLLASFRLSK